jgi:hypothetical protein
MRIGNLVEFQDRRWLVTGKRTGLLCLLRAWDGTEVEVPELADKDVTFGLKVAAQAQAWPFLTAPMRVKEGPVIRVTLMRTGQQRELQPLVDWAPASPYQPGGALFFNPALRLQRSEVLIAIRQRGKMDRLVVSTGFGTLKQRQQRASLANQPPPKVSVYDHLLADDEDS